MWNNLFFPNIHTSSAGPPFVEVHRIIAKLLRVVWSKKKHHKTGFQTIRRVFLFYLCLSPLPPNYIFQNNHVYYSSIAPSNGPCVRSCTTHLHDDGGIFGKKKKNTVPGREIDRSARAAPSFTLGNVRKVMYGALRTVCVVLRLHGTGWANFPHVLRAHLHRRGTLHNGRGNVSTPKRPRTFIDATRTFCRAPEFLLKNYAPQCSRNSMPYSIRFTGTIIIS